MTVALTHCVFVLTIHLAKAFVIKGLRLFENSRGSMGRLATSCLQDHASESHLRLCVCGVCEDFLQALQSRSPPSPKTYCNAALSTMCPAIPSGAARLVPSASWAGLQAHGALCWVSSHGRWASEERVRDSVCRAGS